MEFHKITRKHLSGTDLPQNRETVMDKATWVRCMPKDKEFLKTIKKQSSGTDLLQNRDML
jgi:hypothetical protein